MFGGAQVDAAWFEDVTTTGHTEPSRATLFDLVAGLADPVFSLCRVTKEAGEVNVEFDLRHQGGGVVSVSFAEFVQRLRGRG